ncbi:uncharacterized protein BYT42DRAFT_551099 [Radiomyces spectabilis]|uniref:uncharacterized protein n=1 Tax=Radiomyces spectabilis TaxID=64574 RepID=UPI002220B29D|nr:uncharacterized protein BYT42DRAFT_551099 [Radiomyces spectabilis]KAI8393457.1 hypothetical protein BYT42DRAFT_551099 [Radiomyces spectabilis]
MALCLALKEPVAYMRTSGLYVVSQATMCFFVRYGVTLLQHSCTPMQLRFCTTMHGRKKKIQPKKFFYFNPPPTKENMQRGS